MIEDLVSVIIPSYNSANYICEAVDSVLNQSYRNLEIIIIDDGSKDNTEEVLQKYSTQIRYFKKENGGASSARNYGIKKSNGEWIAFLDADDIWMVNKVGDQLSELKKYNGTVHTCNVQLERTNLSYNNYFSSIEFHPSASPLRSPIEELVKYHFPWLQSTLLHKSLLGDGILFSEEFPIYEDFDFFLRIAKKGKWVVSKEIWTQILRREGENLSSFAESHQYEAKKILLEIYISCFISLESPNDKKIIKRKIKNSLSALINIAYKSDASSPEEKMEINKLISRYPSFKIFIKKILFSLVY